PFLVSVTDGTLDIRYAVMGGDLGPLSGIEVHQIIHPGGNCLADVIVGTDAGDCSKSNVTFTVTATDNCSAATVICNPPSGSTFPRGTNLVNCTATDQAGNMAMSSFNVVVYDTSPPLLSGCPSNLTVDCITNVPAAAMVTAVDNCDGVVSVSFSETQSDPG